MCSVRVSIHTYIRYKNNAGVLYTCFTEGVLTSHQRWYILIGTVLQMTVRPYPVLFFSPLDPMFLTQGNSWRGAKISRVKETLAPVTSHYSAPDAHACSLSRLSHPASAVPSLIVRMSPSAASLSFAPTLTSGHPPISSWMRWHRHYSQFFVCGFFLVPSPVFCS